MRSSRLSRPGSWYFPLTNYRSGSYAYQRTSLLEEVPTAPIDYTLLSVVVILALAGVVVVYSATYHQGLGYLKSHFFRVLLGFIALWVGMRRKLTRLESYGFSWFVLIIGVLAMLGTLLFGDVIGVAKRDFLGIQPQEFAKYSIIVWLAGYFAKLKESDTPANFVNSVIKPGLPAGLIVGLTLAQPAVGTSVIIALSCFVIFIFAGVKWRYILFILVVAAVLVAIGLLMMPHLRNTEFKYIPERWEKFRAGDRYHQTQALIALGSGGPMGKGLGEGRQKYYFLPKLSKDFIFCAIGEEFGFWGCLAIMGLYGLFFLRTLKIAEKASSEFRRLVSGGVGVIIMLYAVIHIAVAVNILPTTGQPLPFISYGGSAIVANMLAVGLVLNVSRYRRSSVEDKNFDRRGWNRWPYFSRSRPGK